MIVEHLDDRRLFLWRRGNKSMAKEFIATTVGFGKPRKEDSLFVFGGPFREDYVYEFVHLGLFCPGGRGGRNDYVGHGHHDGVLFRAEGSQSARAFASELRAQRRSQPVAGQYRENACSSHQT